MPPRPFEAMPLQPPVIVKSKRRPKKKFAISRSRSRSRSSSPTRSDASGSYRANRRRRRGKGRPDRYGYSSADDSYVSSYHSETYEDKRRIERGRSEKALQKTPDASPRGEVAERKIEDKAEANLAPEAAADLPSLEEDVLKLVEEQLKESTDKKPTNPDASPGDVQQDVANMSLAERMRKNVEDLSNLDLYDDSPESRLFGRLLETIKKLELEKEHIAREFRAYRRGLDQSDESAGESDAEIVELGDGITPKFLEIQPKYEIHHSVECDEDDHKKANYAVFRDQPALYAGDDADGHLQGKDEIKNVRRYLEGNKNVVFVAEREYSCRHYQGQLDSERDKGLIDRFDRLKRDGPKANVNRETIRITNNDLLDLLNGMVLGNREMFPNYPLFDNDIPAPYHFFYHHRVFLEEQAKDKEDPRKRLLVPLLAFIKETYQAEWDEADALFVKGETTPKHISKLFRPGDIVVSRKDGKLIGYEVAQWPGEYGAGFGMSGRGMGGASIACTNFMFHGYFYRSSYTLSALPPIKERLNNAPFAIDRLETYPLRYCPPSTQDELISRGKKFWSVRNRSFICYSGFDFEQDERYVRLPSSLQYVFLMTSRLTLDLWSIS
jgi:hypothetical protein